jgi:hypothetical protein
MTILLSHVTAGEAALFFQARLHVRFTDVEIVPIQATQDMPG